MAGHQSIFNGTININSTKIHEKSYYLNDTTVITKYLIPGEAQEWGTRNYEFRAIDSKSIIVTTFDDDGGQTESTVIYSKTIYGEDGKHTDSGDVTFSYKHPSGEIYDGVGTWECQHMNIEEIPEEFIPENYVPIVAVHAGESHDCLLYTSPSPRDRG